MPSSMLAGLRRFSCIALVVAAQACFAPAPVAQPAKSVEPVADQIGRLEREVAQHGEAAARRKTPEPLQDMQYLLAMARLSSLYIASDRVQDSWPLSERMLSIMERLRGPDHPDIVAQLEATAASYGLQGRYAEAERLRRRAITIVEKAFGQDSIEVATSLQGMAQLMRLQDRTDDALPFATRALALADRRLPAGDPRRAVFVSQVADVHMTARRYSEAAPLLQQALALLDAGGGLPKLVVGMQRIQLMQSLSQAYLGQGQHAEARPWIDRSIALSTELLGPEHAITGATLMSLALQLADSGALDAAEELMQRALPISRKNGALRSALADNYVGLGIVAYRRGDWRRAREQLAVGTRIAIERERTAAAGSVVQEASRVAAAADIYLLQAVAAWRLAEGEALAQAAALREEAFELAQRAERSAVARALAAMASRQAAGDGPLARLVRERQDLADEWRRLDRRLEGALASPAERDAAGEHRDRERLIAIAGRLAAIDGRIAREFPDYAKLSDPAPSTIGEVQRLLGPREVLLFLAHRPSQSLVWAIRRDGVRWSLVEVGDEHLARELAALRCGLDETAWTDAGGEACGRATGHTWEKGKGRPLPYDLARAHALYEALLAPFAAMLEDAHVMVATSGPLAAFPLHALVTERPPTAVPPDASGYAGAAWLGRRTTLSLLPSVASLGALRQTARRSVASEPVLAIANPLLEGPDASYADLARAAVAGTSCAAAGQAVPAGASARGRLRALPPPRLDGTLAPLATIRSQVPLPETAAEACAVARALGGRDGDVRLAARATEAEIKRMSASGELARYRVLHFATHGALAGQVSAAAEPGLILTPPGEPTPLDDGYLTASEIAGLRLDADWVILSACNTAGAGKSGAEALSGLARAFLYAQARSVLASHWEVDSTTAVTLIAAMAEALSRDPAIGRASALAHAMSTLATTPATAHPQLWAPFVLVGEGGAGR